MAAATAAILAGPFGTLLLPLPSRTLFWLVLIGWNALKWRTWYRLVPSLFANMRAGSILVAFGGAILLNALLPFEINFMFSAVGHPQSLPFTELFVTAAIISLAISSVIAVVAESRHPSSPALQPVVSAPAPPSLPPSGLAARVDLSGLHAIVAEDHYLRLHFSDGRQMLVLYRFGDALRELAGTDGQQVHRGAWLAATSGASPIRDGRKWRLRLGDGTSIPVSDTYLPAVRSRGWLGQ